MAKKKLDETCDIVKDNLAETIDGITKVAKQGTKTMFDSLLEKGSENVGELIDILGKKLKDKVTKNVKN